MNDWRDRMRVAIWMLFPPPVYFRWLYGAGYVWQLPYYYLRRPLSYIVRRVGRLAGLARVFRNAAVARPY